MSDKINRQQFIKTTVGAAIAMAAGNLSPAAAKSTSTSQDVEQIFRGGSILTLNDGLRQEEGETIRGRRSWW